MDATIDQAPRDLLGHLDRSELQELIRLLELARKKCMDTHAPVSCEGQVCDTADAAQPANP
jgi:hypothetical protein